MKRRNNNILPAPGIGAGIFFLKAAQALNELLRQIGAIRLENLKLKIMETKTTTLKESLIQDIIRIYPESDKETLSNMNVIQLTFILDYLKHTQFAEVEK